MPDRHHGDEYVIAQDFLTWLRENDIKLVHPGHGHNELDFPVSAERRARLAEDFTRREIHS